MEKSRMTYPPETVDIMKKFYGTLSEKDKRRYAATEAMKLGHGGITVIAKILGCARSTIQIGITELSALPTDGEYDARIRQPGGGRKTYEHTIPFIDDAFLDVVKNHTAGDPMDNNVRWTNLTHTEIKQRLVEDHQIQVSETVVIQLLKKHHFTRRKAQKKRR